MDTIPTPAANEQVVAIAATGNRIICLTSSGRMFSSEFGRRALGWTLLPDPLAAEDPPPPLSA